MDIEGSLRLGLKALLDGHEKSPEDFSRGLGGVMVVTGYVMESIWVCGGGWWLTDCLRHALPQDVRGHGSVYG